MKNKFKVCISGLIIGILSGLFSSGGGIIALVCFNRFLKIPDKEARAMTIFCILPMVLSSLIIYNKSNIVDFKLGILCGIGGLIGGAVGSILLDKISDKYLELIFICFLIYSAFKLFFS